MKKPITKRQVPWVLFISTTRGIVIEVVYAYHFENAEELWENYISDNLAEFEPTLLWTEKGSDCLDEFGSASAELNNFFARLK